MGTWGGDERGDRRLSAFLVTETISNIGSWATLIALWGVAQYHFGVGAGGVTALAICWSLPAVLLAPVVGLSIDRFGPGRILYLAHGASILILLAMVASSTFGQLVVLATVAGTARAFSDPALLALPPRLVGDVDLPRFNGAVRMTYFLAIVIGPAVGAFAIDLFGFDGAFMVDALSFGIGMAGLTLLDQRRLGGRLDARRTTSMGTDMAAGWRIVKASGTLRRLMLVTMAISTLYGSYMVLEPLYVKRVLERSASTFGWLQSTFGLTLVVAGVYAMRRGERLAQLRVCAASAVAAAAAAVLYLGSTSVAVAFAGVAVWGVTTAFYSAPSATLLHRHAPGEAHGRVMAFERMVDAAIKLVASLTAGLLAAGVGVRPAAVVFAGISLAISIPVLGLGWRLDNVADPAAGRRASVLE